MFVGDRGMITQAHAASFKAQGVDFVSALKSVQIRSLVDAGDLQLSLFDEVNLAEITHDAFPGERLVVCRNPAVAAERARKRTELLTATETELEKVKAIVHGPRGRLRGAEAGQIGERAGTIVNKYKVAKHFTLTSPTAPSPISARPSRSRARPRWTASTRSAPPCTAERLGAPAAVRAYKQLKLTERAFRTMKDTIEIRPIHHHLEDRVRAHVFLCMLAYYVAYELHARLAPLLFTDENPACNADPVAPATAHRPPAPKPARTQPRRAPRPHPPRPARRPRHDLPQPAPHRHQRTHLHPPHHPHPAPSPRAPTPRHPAPHVAKAKPPRITPIPHNTRDSSYQQGKLPVSVARIVRAAVVLSLTVAALAGGAVAVAQDPAALAGNYGGGAVLAPPKSLAAAGNMLMGLRVTGSRVQLNAGMGTSCESLSFSASATLGAGGAFEVSGTKRDRLPGRRSVVTRYEVHGTVLEVAGLPGHAYAARHGARAQPGDGARPGGAQLHERHRGLDVWCARGPTSGRSR